jgi:hypothetical protein
LPAYGLAAGTFASSFIISPETTAYNHASEIGSEPGRFRGHQFPFGVHAK